MSTKAEKRAYDMAYRAAHRERRKADHAAWYAANREAIAVRRAAWRKANREQERLRDKARYVAHRDEKMKRVARYKAAYPEKVRRANGLYWHSARGRYIHTQQMKLRRARKKQTVAISSDLLLTRLQWENIIRLANGHCYWNWCHRKMTHPTQDHIIPLVKGGLHTASNVVAACRSCNSKKYTKTLTLF